MNIRGRFILIRVTAIGVLSELLTMYCMTAFAGQGILKLRACE
jgi:hypothetical protein